MKKLILAALVLSSCAAVQKSNKVFFAVETNPPDVVIEKDGITLCSSTPCRIELECKTNFLTGNKKSPFVVIQAVPKRALAEASAVITKSVNPCAALEGEQKLFFNLNMEQVMPTIKYDIKHH